MDAYLIRTIILNDFAIRVSDEPRDSYRGSELLRIAPKLAIDMFEFSIRGKSRPQGATSGMYIGPAERSPDGSMIKSALTWIRNAQNRIKQRVDLFISTRRLPGARIASMTRFNTSFGAFPEESALEKINFRLKALEHDWIEAEKAYQSTQKVWNETWEELKQLQKRRHLAGDEKEKSLQAMLARSEGTVLGSFEMLSRRIQDLHSRLTALLKSARN
jgi:hypothetical protein